MFRVNLGPLDALDSFIEKILALDTTKSFLRKQIKLEELSDLNKSAALSPFQKKTEEKSHFTTSFWHSSSN